MNSSTDSLPSRNDDIKHLIIFHDTVALSASLRSSSLETLTKALSLITLYGILL